MADNKRGRGDRDENQENRNECKSAKAIKLLREVTSLLSEGDSEPYQPAAEQMYRCTYVLLLQICPLT